MADINYLVSKKNEYLNFYSKASETARRVQVSIDKLDEIVENQKTAYIVEGNGGDAGQLKYIREKEVGVLNKINNNILPRVRSTINRLNSEIETELEKAKQELETGV